MDSEPEDENALPPAAPSAESSADGNSTVRTLASRVQAEASEVLVGLEGPLRLCLEALLAGGHVLIEGPPGVAKTLLVRTLARTLGCDFARVQFTPDLMPADVTGTSIFHPGDGTFRFQPGP
ncbi:MAG TPA: magnesium chelatase, partial [Planctomycetes bacterium]|nr:magnesium chelatase [Planctomycetota bacterium]